MKLLKIDRRQLLKFGIAALVLSAMSFGGIVIANESSMDCDNQQKKLEVFTQVSQSAVSSACNDAGYWEAGFGPLQTFVFVPEGKFEMGSDDGLDNERPAHQVRLDPYWIAKFPVTVAQFREFVKETAYVTDAQRGWGAWQWTGEVATVAAQESDPWTLKLDGHWNNIYFAQSDNDPVGSVSWNDANQYAAWLSTKLGVAFVLPTEAQWEYAARGVDNRKFPWGDSHPGETRANFADKQFAGKYGEFARRTDLGSDDGFVETSPVDAFPEGQSVFGVYDLAGNLGEWVYDVFDPEYYLDSPQENPTGPEPSPGKPDAEIDRVNRGGSWVDWAGVDAEGRFDPDGGHNIRSAARTGDEQNSSDDHMGFRLAVDGMRHAQIKAPAEDMPDLEGVTINTYQVSEHIYMLEASGDVAGNIAVSVGSDGVLIVDDQFAELVPAIEKALQDLSSGRLRFIINTHHHDDHSDGNAAISTKHEATIVAHELTRQRLLEKGPGQWPVVTFDQHMSIHFNHERIRLQFLPGGHTDNDIVVFFESSNVVHLGDLMNAGKSSFPVADLQAGGNALQILKNVETVMPMIAEDAVIIPGHGPVSDKAGLRQLHEMLKTTITHVRVNKEGGMSLQDCIEDGLPAKYKDWGFGYMSAEGWIEMIYQSLNQTKGIDKHE